MSVRKRHIDPSDKMEMYSKLSSAVLKSNTLNTKELLNQGANPLAQYDKDPIFFTASIPNLRLLIKRGISINSVNRFGATLLSNLCSIYPVDIEKIQFVLDNGADVNLADSDGDTPLHVICLQSKDPLVVQLLLRYGAQVDLQNNEGNTPLHSIAESQNSDFPAEECIQLLLEAGLNPLTKNRDGMTALEMAEAYLRPIELINILKKVEEKAKRKAEEPHLIAAQHVAIRMGDRRGQVMPSSVARHISNFLRPSKTYKNIRKQAKRNAGEDVNMLNAPVPAPVPVPAPAPAPAPAHQHWQNHQFNYQDPAYFNLMGGRRRKARSHRRRTRRSKGRSKGRR